jgi:hypothetical protein
MLTNVKREMLYVRAIETVAVREWTESHRAECSGMLAAFWNA